MLTWLTGKTAKSPELKEAESVFTETELKDLEHIFRQELIRQAETIHHQHHAPHGGRGARAAPARDGGLDAAHFARLLGPSWSCLDPLTASHLLYLLADRHDGKVHLPGLIIAKARADRLGEQASLRFTYGLLCPDGKGARYIALEAAIVSCLRLTGAVHGPVLAEPRVGGAAAQAPGTSIGAAGSDPKSGSGDGASSSRSSSSSNTANVRQHIAAICRAALAQASAGASTEQQHGTAHGDVRLSYEEYCQWTKTFPALHKTLSAVLRHVGSSTANATAGSGVPAGPATAAASGPSAMSVGRGGCSDLRAASTWGADPLRLPVLLQLGKLEPTGTLLQPVWTWALAGRLPPAQRCEWRLLFSSQRDGKSFNTFYSRVSGAGTAAGAGGGGGPTLLLIRDKGGAVFGGYASQPWTKSGTYYGDVSCFIFSLLPVMQVFPATGINDNYQWCGVGFSQLPGGLGFGGAAAARGHFALYVEPTLDHGMSRPIATYGNTPLASEQIFPIDTLECWLLQPREEEPGSDVSSHARANSASSVLSKGAEDRAILELAGHKMHSAGMRDEPLEED